MPGRYENRLMRVPAYIHDNPGGDLSLGRLAGEAAMSRFHWHRVFRAMTGETCARAVRRIGLHRAAHLLVQGNAPVAEVAAQCGYPNPASFARAFAAAHGVRPGAFREAGRLLASLWSADDPAAWQWRAMIRLPDDTGADLFGTARDTALTKLARKKDAATDAAAMSAIRLERLDEGDCLQTLHVGPYADETPVLADLHDRLMPELGLTFGGAHHEIYLSDPRRVAPDRLKTILRQPVVPL